MARTAVIPVRLTPEERDELRKQAETHHVSLSDYIRRIVLKRRMPLAAAPEVNRETYNQLRRVGNNLNQLAHAMNLGSNPVGIDANLLGELKALVKEIGFQVLGANDDR